MRNILKVIVIALLAWGFSFFLPFWGAAVAGFIGSLLIRTSNVASFITGFIAVFVLWGMSAFLIDLNNQHLMAGRIGELFSMSPPFMVLVTAVVGGVTGALGSLFGCTVAGIFSQ